MNRNLRHPIGHTSPHLTIMIELSNRLIFSYFSAIIYVDIPVHVSCLQSLTCTFLHYFLLRTYYSTAHHTQTFTGIPNDLSSIWKEVIFMLMSQGEQGQGFLEYALILILIAIVVIIALTIFGTQLSTLYSQISSSIPGP